MGKRLHRLRHRCSSLEVSEPRPALNLLKLLCLLRELAKICCKRRRVRCRRLHATTADPKRTPGDLRAANRQDSIGAADMAGPSISRIKKIIIFAPSKCPIDLFGPVSNRTILKRLHGASRSSSRNPRLPGADGSWGPQPETSGVSVNRKPETYHNSEAETCNLQPTSRPLV